MSHFFESIRITDGEICLLDYHQRRMDRTCTASGGAVVPDIMSIFASLCVPRKGVFKLRISYDLQGHSKAEIIPYQSKKIIEFQTVTDDFIEYEFKYEDRKCLNRLKVGGKEIIIIKNGHITDTSFSNLVFLRDGQWYTPNTYLLNGVQRQSLLASCQIFEAEILKDNIKNYSHFQLINAMIPLHAGYIFPVEFISQL